MSSYFDKASSDISECRMVGHLLAGTMMSDEDFIKAAICFENQVASDCMLCAGDKEFPEDLRQKIVGHVSLFSLGYKDMAPSSDGIKYMKALKRSKLIGLLHEDFHELARRRITTRFGLMLDNPAEILKDRDRHILETNPCPECGKVEIVDICGKPHGNCPCADRPWDVDSIPQKP